MLRFVNKKCSINHNIIDYELLIVVVEIHRLAEHTHKNIYYHH